MRLCILAAYPREVVSQATIQTVNALCLAGYTVIFVNSNHAVRVPQEIKRLVYAIYTRQNGGYDWGAWSEVMPRFKALWDRPDCESVLLTNDSFVAPVFGQESFEQKLKELRDQNPDVSAMTISHEVRRHIQSYWIEIKTKFFRESHTLKAMLNESRLRSLKTVKEVIEQYETTFLAKMLREYPDLKVATLYESSPERAETNPYIHDWDGPLRENAFPLFKLSVLRLSDHGHAKWSEDLDRDTVEEWCRHNAANSKSETLHVI